MSRLTYYSSTKQAEDAMSVIAGWIGSNRKIRVIYHNGTAVDACTNKKSPNYGTIRIPKMACSSGITEEGLMLFRGRIYHEAGHIDITDHPDTKDKVLFDIWNALEDRWMETEEGKKHIGCKMVFDWMTNYYNKELAAKFQKGEVNDAPLWEALVAMSFMVDGLTPKWSPSPKAQAYIDAAYNLFAKVKASKNSAQNFVLAKEIYDLLKKTSDEFNKEQGKGQQGQQGQQGQGQPQQGQKSGEPQSQMSDDFEDENEKPEKGDGSSGSGDEDGEDSDGSGEGEGKEPGKEGDEKDGKGDKDGKDGSGKGDEKKDEKKDGKGDSGDSDEDGDKEGQGSKDGGSKPGKGSKDEEPGDSDSGGETVPSLSNKGKKNNSPARSKKVTALEEELDGISREEIVDEAIEEFINNIDPRDSIYLSRRDLDKHVIPDTMDDDKEEFKNERETIAVMVATMTRSLEQALRSLARTKKLPYLQQGRVDMKRLVQISKGLSREVFYKTRQGLDLNTAVEIIIDESGSMGNFMAVRLLAIALGEALNAIHVPFEITGTTTSGDAIDLGDMTRTNPIIYNHYKSFAEKWDVVRHRMVHTGAHNNNIDGEAIEYCAFRLGQRNEKRKIILSLSDGSPCGGQGMDAELAANIIRVCERCRGNGIEVYGFGIQTQAPAKYYGKKFFMYLQDIANCGPEFFRKIADVITGGLIRL